MVLIQVQEFGTWTRYGVEILRKCGKMVETKTQKGLGANSYICRSYKEKTGRGAFLHPHPE